MEGIGNILFAPAVEIDAGNLPANLVEANVVKALEARSIDGPDSMVRHEKVFLPAHEDTIPV